jgi:adenine-specific DNA-methyltransferase
VGINAAQITRDRLAEAGASFDILKIQDGVKFFRKNPQTMRKLFALIKGFRYASDSGVKGFWDGKILQCQNYIPVKFIGFQKKLNEEVLDFCLREICKLQAPVVMIIYNQKEDVICQDFIEKKIKKEAKNKSRVLLKSLDELLEEKKDYFFAADNAQIELSPKKEGYQVAIKKFFSPYLKNKLDEYNQKIKLNSEKKPIELSASGLELIEAVQFDTSGSEKLWKSNLELEDKAAISQKIKGSYFLNTRNFKIKIRNIAGDELVIDSKTLS